MVQTGKIETFVIGLSSLWAVCFHKNVSWCILLLPKMEEHCEWFFWLIAVVIITVINNVYSGLMNTVSVALVDADQTQRLNTSATAVTAFLHFCCSSDVRTGYMWCVDLSAFMTSMCVQWLCSGFSRCVTVSWRSFCHSWCRSDATLRCNLMILSLKGHLPLLNNDQKGLYHKLQVFLSRTTPELYSHGHSLSWGRLWNTCSGQLSDQTHAFGCSVFWFILTHTQHFLLLLLLLWPCNRPCSVVFACFCTFDYSTTILSAI